MTQVYVDLETGTIVNGPVVFIDDSLLPEGGSDDEVIVAATLHGARVSATNPDAEQSLWSQVFGSGFETFSWWRKSAAFTEGSWDVPGVAVLEVEDPDDSVGMPLTFTVNDADLNSAAAVVKALYPHVFEDDIDAVAADIIVQTACFGEVIYG